MGIYISFLFFFFHSFLFYFLMVFYFNSIMLSFSFFYFFSLNFDFIFLVDSISLGFSCFVVLISSAVFAYSNFYMEGDVTLSRFYYILILFVFSMLILIFGCNMFSLMVGWDGLGVVSFMLVIYYNNFSSLCSGLLTVLSNRFGDLGMLFSFFLLFWKGWWNQLYYVYEDLIFLSVLLIFSSMTKSAQFPFSAWLPAAMSAPTPVSSLVHSSTLVTAGVYLMIRFYYSFSFLYCSECFCFISILTMFMSGILAIYDLDLKKVIAMSTLSQLGFMMYSISLGEWMMSFFHMVCHALYKSLLFLSVGVFINFFSGGQDLRVKGSLVFLTPFSFLVFIFSSLSLIGFPFLSGFYSKDLILEGTFLGFGSLLSSFFLIFSCIFSFIYSLRLLLNGICSYANLKSFFSLTLDKSTIVFIFILFFWSVWAGYFFGELLFLESIYYVFAFLKIIPFFIYFFGILFYYLIINFGLLNSVKFMISSFAYLYWFSGNPISNFMSKLEKFSFVELTWLEELGPKLTYFTVDFSFYSNYFLESFYKIIFLLLGGILMIVFVKDF